MPIKMLKGFLSKPKPKIIHSKPKKEIWVCGYPGAVGGAGTELDHQIDLWRMHDVEVNLCSVVGEEPHFRESCTKRGCKTHEYYPEIFRDKIVVSYCNDVFLMKMPEIVAYGKPRLTVWFNCMTWVFDYEIEAHKRGWIDIFGFQTQHQRSMLVPKLAEIRPVQEITGYMPFFNCNNINQKFNYKFQSSRDYLGIGRLSRDDSSKFSSDMWRIYDRILTPGAKKVFVMGFGKNAKSKCGLPPEGLDWMTMDAGSMPASKFYKKIHLMVHKTGGSGENLPRVLLESWATGVVPVVEKAYGFIELVEDGITGFMSSNSDTMSYRASELAFDEDKRKKMAEAGHRYLLNTFGDHEKCFAAWDYVLSL
jgi:hypothetical protein